MFRKQFLKLAWSTSRDSVFSASNVSSELVLKNNPTRTRFQCFCYKSSIQSFSTLVSNEAKTCLRLSAAFRCLVQKSNNVHKVSGNNAQFIKQFSNGARPLYQSSPKQFKFISSLLLACGGFAGGLYYLHRNTYTASIIPSVHAASQKNNFIADVVEKSAPAVVFLEVKGRHPLTGKIVTLSNGSGFIVRSNGIVLTNAHVVANRSVVSVKLQDGRTFDGQVTAVDPITDLATVKIPGMNLPTIPLGDSGRIRPGEWVIAMGSPLSLNNTVTCGIVSSVQRASKELGLRNKDMDYIQTDAVINFGNSGGPLVDLEGRAIGINTMKVTTGISFAIPSDYAIKFLAKAEAIMKKGQTENGFSKRRYIGITMLTLTESVMRDLKNNINVPSFPDVNGGVFVYKVIPGTPAHVDGIMAGDIIIDISGKPIKSSADFYDIVENSADVVKVTVIRGQNKKTITVNTQVTI